MTDGVSSARPARLLRFGETTAAMEEGLATRIRLLSDALVAYRGACDAGYRAPTLDTAEVVAAWTAGMTELGRWVHAVGEGFDRAGSGDNEEPLMVDDAAVIANLDEAYQDDPFLGVPAGGWQLEDGEIEVSSPDELADALRDLGLSNDAIQAAVDQYVKYVRTPETVSLHFKVVDGAMQMLADDGRVLFEAPLSEVTPPGFRLPGADTELASRWLQRVGAAADFASGAYEQWQADADLPGGLRLLRAGTEGAGGATGAWALAALGAQAGLFCAPGALVCSAVLGFAGALAGAVGGEKLGRWLVDMLPWMDEPPQPGEHDLDDLTGELAQEDGELSDEMEPLDATVSLIGHDIATGATADQPLVHAELESVLPDREELTEATGLVFEEGPPSAATTTSELPTVESSEPAAQAPAAPDPNQPVTATTSSTTTTTTTTSTTVPPTSAPAPTPTPTTAPPPPTLPEGR